MKRALLLSKVDREDLWVNGFVFPISDSQFYEDNLNEIREKLLTDEFQKALISKFCLDADLFAGDDTYKCVDVQWVYKAIFTFKNSAGDIVEFSLYADHIDMYGSNNGVNADTTRAA